MALWSRLTSLIAGIGISSASSVVIQPALEPERQKAWLASLAQVLDPGALARLVASGLLDEGVAADEAARNGYAADKFAALVQLELHGATLAQALEIWNRDPAAEPLLDHALAKAQIEPQYWPALKGLAQVRIPADLLAFAHQRGIVPNPKDPVTGQLLIPVSPPTTSVTDVNGQPSPVQQQPVDIDVLAEFAATGWDFERAAVNARARGLPPAPGELLQLVNRGVISTDEYYVGIGEGDTRNEWRDYLLELRRRLLTPHEYAELFLRGWLPDMATMQAGASLSGMTPDDATLLYDLLGRPLAVHQVTTGLQRGGQYGAQYQDIPEPFLTAVRQSNIRPEWYSLAYANRYTIPGYFVIEALAKKGALTPAQVEGYFLDMGWPPDLAQQASTLYGGPSTSQKGVTVAALADEYEAGHLTPGDYTAALEQLGYTPAEAATEQDLADYRTAKKYRDETVAAVGKQYVAHELTDAQARATLAQLGLTQGAIDQTMFYLGIQQQTARRSLTAAQVKRAYAKQVLTETDAVTALEALGYTQADADTYLKE